MEPYIIEPTDDSPKIHFDKSSGIFEISGRSLPEEVIKFYTPVLQWIDNYSMEPNDITIVKLKLLYFNSASQRSLLEVLTGFEKILQTSKKITVEWYYLEDDEDMKESGEEYEDLVDIPFKFITYVPE